MKNSSSLFSYFTILKPQDSLPSVAASTFRNFNDQEESNTWQQRIRLIFRILTFCLGPGNIWRFPQQAFLYGNATYIYVYIVYIIVFGVSLLVFEISLGQYITNGFAKIFNSCPIMEGLTLSIVIYCVMANILYSSIAVYSITYIFSIFRETMSHSYCSDIFNNYNCINNYTNQSSSPEFLYFFYFVQGTFFLQRGAHNWRNTLISLLLWTFVCLIVLFGILKYKLVSVILSCAIFLVLFCLAITSLTLEGAGHGMLTMFKPSLNDMNQLETWIYPIQQCVVSLGVGAGPLTTVWIVTEVKDWSYVDCIVIDIFAICCSILSCIIFFNTAGFIASRNNSTIQEYFEHRSQSQVHVIYTQFINSLGYGISHVIIFVYYLMLTCSCCYALLEQYHIILLYWKSYITINSKFLRIIVRMSICILLFVTTSIGVSEVGYPIVSAINKNFISTAPLLIIFFELITILYFYGMYNFCDDIEFLLGYSPSYYFQISWISLSVLSGIFSICSYYLKFKNIRNGYDFVILLLAILFILTPIIILASCKCFVAIRNKQIRGVLNPRLYEANRNKNLPGPSSP